MGSAKMFHGNNAKPYLDKYQDKNVQTSLGNSVKMFQASSASRM